MECTLFAGYLIETITYISDEQVLLSGELGCSVTPGIRAGT